MLFLLIFVILVLIGWAIYYFGKEVTYCVNNSLSLENLAIDDFLLMPYPDNKRDGYLIFKILKIDHEYMYLIASRNLYQTKQDFMEVIIDKNYIKNELKFELNLRVSKENLNEQLSQSILLHKKR